MCASDEFHFIPRSESASRYYDRLEDLSNDSVQQFMTDLGSFEIEFKRMGDGGTRTGVKGYSEKYQTLSQLDDTIDLELLEASTAALRIEFEQKQSWRNNPLLYLKVALIGIDHALSKPAPDLEERVRRASSRLRAIPRLLKQAARNIDDVPQLYLTAALQMVRDGIAYLEETEKNCTYGDRENFSRRIHSAQDALSSFGLFLSTSVTPILSFSSESQLLQATLQTHFRYQGTADDVFRIGMKSSEDNQALLKELQIKIDRDKSWKQLYESFAPPHVGHMDTLNLYRQEYKHLHAFFLEHGLGKSDLSESLHIVETPTYLRSVRGSASFSAAFSQDQDEASYFYITTKRGQQQSRRAANSLKNRLHREYRFLTAHETVPGHHLLDRLRRESKNPIRRQIESPLFYEGWASYVESLLGEYGYLQNDLEHLVICKRNLWRATRCQVDVGIVTGSLSQNDGVTLLENGGFSREEALAQIHRFRLNPGYQLCYTLGHYEILKLRRTYGTLFGKKRFHRMLLEGGELPFQMIDARWDRLKKRDCTQTV
jgi:hypothetical protein